MTEVNQNEAPYNARRGQTRIKNIVWGILGGYVVFLYFVIIGVAYCLTVIGVKKGYACFKFAVFSLAPFGKNAAADFLSHKAGNTFFTITTGWQISLYCLLTAGLWYATYFGRYLGNKWFHLAQFVLMPFGAKIMPTDLLNYTESGVVSKRDKTKEFEI